MKSSTDSLNSLKKQCVAQNPTRFEIGPVYSTNPRDRKTLRRAAAFKPIAKELVFDIDMDSYDEIRTCCTGANICNRCWSFIKMAVKVVNTALEEDFGFKHVLWVYSGRRGIHGWVCDKKARDLDDAKRRSIANYMDLIKGGDASGKKVNIRRPLHPHFDRSLRLLRDHFQSDILKEQDPWHEADKAAHLLALIPDKQLATSLSKKWDSAPSRSSINKWADIDSLASSGGASSSLDTKKLLEAKQDIVLEYTYPRLDAEVSKHLNHLLKSPFCVHPKTGRICVPVDPRHVDDFDPFEVPTVTELLRQIDEWQESHKDEEGDVSRVQDWEKTALKPYVEYFRGFVNALIKDEQGGKRKKEDDGTGMEF
jgi:DNA primase small subunit